MRKHLSWILAILCALAWLLLASGIVTYSDFGWDEADRRIFGTLAVLGAAMAFVDYIVKRANALEREVHELQAVAQRLEQQIASLEQKVEGPPMRW